MGISLIFVYDERIEKFGNVFFFLDGKVKSGLNYGCGRQVT